MPGVARVLIACIALAALARCGSAASPSAPAETQDASETRSTVGRDPWHAPSGEPGIYMWEDEKKRGTLRRHTRRGDRAIDTGLDAVSAANVWKYRNVPVLVVAGFHGARHLLVAYGDAELDGIPDERIGTYALPDGAEMISFTPREGTTDFYGFDALGERIFRFIDDDGNGLPERHALFAEVGEHSKRCGLLEVLYFDCRGRAYVEESG